MEVEEFVEPGAKRVVDNNRESSLSFEANCFSSFASDSDTAVFGLLLEEEEDSSLERLEILED